MEVFPLLRSKSAVLIFCLSSLFSMPACVAAPPADSVPSQHLLQGLDAIFNKGGFHGKDLQLAWENSGNSYTILEPAADGKGGYCCL